MNKENICENTKSKISSGRISLKNITSFKKNSKRNDANITLKWNILMKIKMKIKYLVRRWCNDKPLRYTIRRSSLTFLQSSYLSFSFAEIQCFVECYLKFLTKNLQISVLLSVFGVFNEISRMFRCWSTITVGCKHRWRT